MFRCDPTLLYLMPAHFGPYAPQRGVGRYLDVTTISIGYLTDRARLEQYLPEGFEIRGEPTVVVYYAMNREVEWLAGGGYNLVGVDAVVRFRGTADEVEGSLCLVMWENDTDPILAGRELLGVPKLFANVEDHSVIEGEWRTTASVRGHAIIELCVTDLVPVAPAALAQLAAESSRTSWMAWRHLPNVGLPGAAVSHATCIPAAATLTEAFDGRGEVRWHRTTWERNPTQWHIVNALAELPILEYRWARVMRGASTLFDPDKPRLRALR